MSSKTRLVQDLPEFVNNIRTSRKYTAAAVIATGADALRTMLVTVCGEGKDSEVDYHLIHILACGPKDAQLDLSQQTLEIKSYSWGGMLQIIRAFLEGADESRLSTLAAASNSHRRLVAVSRN